MTPVSLKVKVSYDAAQCVWYSAPWAISGVRNLTRRSPLRDCILVFNKLTRILSTYRVDSPRLLLRAKERMTSTVLVSQSKRFTATVSGLVTTPESYERITNAQHPGNETPKKKKKKPNIADVKFT